ncbi:ThiF family adenylyltransferase [Thermopolyspora sp. NPDC052614]|uniref:ThiF family adenylyltransferase n=1 Tax=Thermopolyspora sp. NPDC052614 TaxID=3155682 RepID=UPI00342BE0BC
MTDGLDLAERQLRELAAVSGGSVEILDIQDVERGRWFTISLDTSGISARGAAIRVRDRERFRILVGTKYPYRPPLVQVVHRRWAGTAHVQWGNQLCLYAAPSVEWVPSDGLNGFIERLSTWVVRAAEGTLDPHGQPLHPPVAYPTAGMGTLVVHADIGDRAPWSPGRRINSGEPSPPRATSMVAWCTVDGERLDVLEWSDWLTTYNRVLEDGFDPFAGGRPLVVMPALLISNELGFEYPEKAWDLVMALEAAGFSLDDVLVELANAVIVNRYLRTSQTSDLDAVRARGEVDASDRPPPLTGLLIGTPSRRIDDVRLTHLAGWRIEETGRILASAYADFRRKPEKEEVLKKVGELTREWLQEADVLWMRILENRPEVTRRRDKGTPLTWLAGKRILVLGCGALGAPVAEHCARAGVAALSIVDSGLVTPGILVRQPYNDAEIGRPKATVLAERLSRVRAGFQVEGRHGDALDVFLQPNHGINSFDLVIDATADAGIRSAIENKRRVDEGPWPTVVTMIIGHDATRGLVTVSTPESTGAGASALRQVALHAFANPREWADIANDFFPEKPRTDMFFPEPGCSAPTFIGGSAQTTALAALMLNEALGMLGSNSASYSNTGVTVYASAVRIGGAVTGSGISRVAWGPDTVVVDDTFDYEVRLSPAAVIDMRTEVRRGARVRGPRIETGGMLLGAVDEAAGVIYVDRVTGPPPDSFLSESYFQHGQVGVQEIIEVHQASSRAMTGFVGYWHTHPGGRAAPSPTDEEGMASILAPDGRRQRALMVIVGGPSAEWDRWVSGEGPLPAAFARLVLPSDEPTSGGMSGGFRATVFGLGALRALHDRGILRDVTVVSGISGGSLLAAMWAYGPESFAAFETSVTELVAAGLQLELVRRAFAPRAVLANSVSLVRAVAGKPFGGQRLSTRTEALVRAIAARPFGQRQLDEVTHPGLTTVISATDLATGNAVRFGSEVSSLSSIGDIADSVTVADAVAASAAFPALLPQLNRTYEFIKHDGVRERRTLLMTDGGVYDNLGLTPLLPGRSAAHTSHVYDLDYIIAVDAGQGRPVRTAPNFMLGRLKRSFEIAYSRAQDGSRARLNQAAESGAIRGFIHPYLATRDGRLPFPLADLVPREAVVEYPTNFARMTAENLHLIATRGEQLTRILIEHYCPQLGANAVRQ